MCCPRVLAPNGKVLVSLCNGQGGTLADRPQRKWQDSWQVVAMAAYGSFVLTATVPFSAEDYADYDCTGYRSQSKQFRTRDAVTHVFERSASDLPEVSTTSECTRLRLRSGPDRDVAVDCPPDLASNIEKILLEKADHPLHHLSQELQRLLKSSLPDCSELQDEELPLLLYPEQAIAADHTLPSELYVIDPHSAQTNATVSMHSAGEASVCLGSQHEQCPQCLHTAQPTAAVQMPLTHNSGTPSGKDGRECKGKCIELSSTDCLLRSNMESELGESDKFVLIPNLLCHISRIVSPKQTASACAAFGRVFRRCGITITQYPIMHQCLVVYPACNGAGISLECCMQKLANAISTLVAGRGTISFQECQVDSSCKISQKTSLVMEMEEPNQFNKSTVSIGHCGAYHSIEGDVMYCLLNLDHLAMIKYNVEDIRLLWSSDERIFQKFLSSCTSLKTGSEGDNSNLITDDKLFGYSLYPPVYSHDVSFWLKDDSFDELLFCSVVRSVTCDLVREIHFLNQYINQRVSYTYRLLYQSCDGALSKEMANQLQLNVRTAINKWLGVQPR